MESASAQLRRSAEKEHTGSGVASLLNNNDHKKNDNNNNNESDDKDKGLEAITKSEAAAAAENKPLNLWLGGLSAVAELETMSILYAKSVLEPTVSSQLGCNRVAISCKENPLTHGSMPTKNNNNGVVSQHDEQFGARARANSVDEAPSSESNDDDAKSSSCARRLFAHNNSLAESANDAKSNGMTQSLTEKYKQTQKSTFATTSATMRRKIAPAHHASSKQDKSWRKILPNVAQQKMKLEHNNKNSNQSQQRLSQYQHQHQHQRSGGSLSSPADSCSAGSSSVDEDFSTSSFAMTHSGIIAVPSRRANSNERGSSEAKKNETPSRFALSMPHAQLLREQPGSTRNAHRKTDDCRLSVVNIIDDGGGGNIKTHQNATSNARNACETQAGPSALSVSQSPYVVELRPTRRAANAATQRCSVGAAMLKTPPTFRHSIRVNGDESDTTLDAHHKTMLLTAKSPHLPDKTNYNSHKIYETIAETQFGAQQRLSCASTNLSSGSANAANSDSGQGSAGSSSAIAPHVSGINFSPTLPPRRQDAHLQQKQQGGIARVVADDANYLPGYIRIASCVDQVLCSANALNRLLHGANDGRQYAESFNVTLRFFSTPSERGLRQLFDAALAFIGRIRESLCAPYFADFEEFDIVLRAVCRFNTSATATTGVESLRNDVHVRSTKKNAAYSNDEALSSTDHFIVLARQMLEQSMLVFARIICAYLNECSNTESLLPIALEQLVQVLLFGDDICLEAIKYNAVERALSFVRAAWTPLHTRKMLLRSLAMLCATTKGCLRLLAIDSGLNVIIQILAGERAACASEDAGGTDNEDELSVEAAGVLTQLTRPSHDFVHLSAQCLGDCVRRLLCLVDAQWAQQRGTKKNDDAHANGHALLLCTASLANLSLRSSTKRAATAAASGVASGAQQKTTHSIVAQLLYEHNAPLRLINAGNALRKAHKKNNALNSPLFVQEQIVTLLSRMAASGYSQALIAQHAIPFLLNIFVDCADVDARSSSYASTHNTATRQQKNNNGHAHASLNKQQNADFCRRIRYKAAVCLGMLASSSAGLKALYESRAYNELCELLHSEESLSAASPLALICASLKQRLEATYQVESAV